MNEVIVVFLVNFLQTFARTKQIYFLNRYSKVLASFNSGLIAGFWLISSYLGIKGVAEANWPVVLAYILSNVTATAATMIYEEWKNGRGD